MKKLLFVTLFTAIAMLWPVHAENWMERKAAFYQSYHITTNTTTTVTSATAYLSSVQITCTNAGTTETIKIQSKESTPKVFYQSATLVVGNVFTISYDVPIGMTSGIDIITAGTTAGAVDVWLTYWQL